MPRHIDPIRLAAARAFGIAVRGGTPQALASIANPEGLKLALSYAEHPRGLARTDEPTVARLRAAIAASDAPD